MLKKNLVILLSLISINGSFISPVKAHLKTGFGEGTAAFACFLLWEGYSKYEVESLISRFAKRIEQSGFSEEEMNKLKSIERPSIIKAIAEARSHGDLSENAEYHAARERQSFIEGRIVELENKITRAEVIDPSKLDNSKVTFGATVVLTDLETDKKNTYKI